MRLDRNIKAVMAFSVLIGITIGFNFTMLPVYIKVSLNGSLFQVGLITSLQYLALVIMTFAWGALSDRLARRKSIIVYGNLIASFFYFLFPYLDIIQLTVLRGIQVFFIASWILAYALVTEYRPDARGEVIGYFTLFNSVGWGIGSFMSGFIYDVSITWFFYLAGIFSILSAVVLAPAKDPPMEKMEHTDFRTLFRLKNSSMILTLCVTVLLLVIGSYMVFTLFSIYLEVNGIPIPAIGIVIAISGLPSAMLSSMVGRACDRLGSKIILLSAIGLYAFIWMGYGFVDNIWIVILLWLIPAYTFYTISSHTMMSNLTPSRERGRGIGLLNSFYYMGAFTGSVLGGALAARFDYQPTFIIAALIIIASFIVALKLKESKEAPQTPDPRT